MRLPLALTIPALLLCAADLIAQDVRPPQPAAAKSPPFTVPPGEITLAQLVGMAARYLHANFVVGDPQILADSHPLTLTEPLTTDGPGCLRALAALLSTRGLAVMPLDPDHGIYEILSLYSERACALQDAAAHVPAEAVLADADGKQMVVTTVPLQHVRTAALSVALRPFLSSSMGLGSANNGARLVVKGLRDQVAWIVRFARANDEQTIDAATEQRLAEHVRALEQKMATLRSQVEVLQKVGK